MPNFVDANVINVFNTTIDKLREDIGRNVTIISAPTERACPNCSYDPINKASTNKYEPENPYPSDVEPIGPINFTAQGMRKCPICNGKGKIVLAAQEDEVLCLVSPLTKEDAEKTQLGKNFIKNYELSAQIQYKELFANSKKVIVDGHVCEIVAILPVGIGTLTQLTIYAGGDV